MMKNDIPDSLIAKFLAGECTETELKTLEEWKMANEKNKEEFKKMQIIMDEATPGKYTPDVEAALNKVSDRLGAQKRNRKNYTGTILRIASVLIIAVGILSVFLLHAPKEIIIASMPGDAPREFILPDGSSVTLNEASELKYAKKFKGKERLVLFTGEAYFKITRDKSKPFIIESGETTTRVLGTEFNLIAKKSDTVVKVTVTEGLVSFNLGKNNQQKEVLVKAGQVGTINTQKGVVTSKVNHDLNFMAWKNGALTFENHLFGEAIETVSSFYKKEIEIQGNSLNSAVFTATFDSLEFNEVLSTIELIMDVDIERKDDVTIIREKL